MKKLITTMLAAGALAVSVPFIASASTIDELYAQIAALQAQVAMLSGGNNIVSSVQHVTPTCGFSQELRLGVHDPEVTLLQRELNQSPDTQVAQYGAGSPGQETDFFGVATMQAVIRFQNKYASEILAPMGIDRGTGIVGMATRAKLNSLCTFSNGVVLGASTDIPSNVNTNNTNSNGNSGVTYVPGNGNNSNNNGNYDQNLQGGAGSINVTTTTIDTDNLVKQGMESKVMGFRVEAVDSDVAVTNLKVTLFNTDNSGSSKRLNRYADQVRIYMNGSVVASASIDDFSRDQDTYSKTFSLSSAIVRRGSGNKSTFHVAIEGASVIDSADQNTNSWQVTVSDIRYHDAQGTTLVDGFYGQRNGINFTKLSSSGWVTFRITTDSSNPVAGNVQANTSSATKNIPVLAFRLTAQGSPITIDRVTIDPHFSGVANLSDMVDEFRVLHNGQMLGMMNPSSGGYQTINLDSDYTISQDNTDTFTIVASIRKMDQGSGNSTIFDQGDALTVNLVSVDPQDRNGDNITSGNITGSAYGNQQTFSTKGVTATSFTSSIQTSNSGGYNYPSGQVYTLTYHLRAYGGTYYIPKQVVANQSIGTAGLALNVLNGGTQMLNGSVNVVVGSINSTANTVGNYYELDDGMEQTFNVTVAVNPTTGANARAGMYSLQLVQAGYTDNSSGNGNFSAYNFVPQQNYRTNEAYIGSY